MNPTFQVSSGLIDPKHVEAMGPAVWVYLALIDMQTSPDGTVFHKQAGGVRIAQISQRLGMPKETVRRHLRRLRPYLRTEKTEHGMTIQIRSPKKRFRVVKNDHTDRSKMNGPSVQICTDPPFKNERTVYKEGQARRTSKLDPLLHTHKEPCPRGCIGGWKYAANGGVQQCECVKRRSNAAK